MALWNNSKKRRIVLLTGGQNAIITVYCLQENINIISL